MRRIVAVAVVAVALASCGGSSGSPDGDNASATTGGRGQAAGPAATTVANNRVPGVPDADVRAIQELVTYLEYANAAAMTQWLDALAASNYLVWSGAVPADQCREHIRRSLGFLANARVQTRVDISTLEAVPEREHPVVGGVPQGRTYTAEARFSMGPRDGSRMSEPVARPFEVVIVDDGSAKRISPCS